MFGYEDELQDEIDKLKEQLHKWKAIAERSNHWRR